MHANIPSNIHTETYTSRHINTDAYIHAYYNIHTDICISKIHKNKSIQNTHIEIHIHTYTKETYTHTYTHT